ncbi:MAG: HD domain-containing protein [Ruminococcus flavefaciens]|nr:HD domain-containing protein [Ruminococcus flavefaciens]
MSATNDNKCMIYKSKNNTSEETKYYNQQIKSFADYLSTENSKGKFPLIITGSGISDQVPNMSEMMDKLKNLILSIPENGINSYSNTFQEILKEYNENMENPDRNEAELHTQQSRLLTYIQNAYLGKVRFVDSSDTNLLTNVWTEFIIWLLNGDDKKPGIIKARPSKIHQKIVDFYKTTSAISITTNFDNLLAKAFDKENNFFPILEKETFEAYYTSDSCSNNYIEIQSRGDVFWVKCTGKNNRICPNTRKRCYIPGKSVSIKENITCDLCNSPAEVYFAFPGTKEKDAEMSMVIDGIWKFFAYRLSAVIMIGISMNYDPVLLNFIKEITKRRNIPTFYISPYPKNKEELSEINMNAATKYLFRNTQNTLNIWGRADKTQEILADILKNFITKNTERIEQATQKQAVQEYEKWINGCIGETDIEQFNNTINSIASSNSRLKFITEPETNKMKYYSQLGLKTYWLEGENEKYILHNRYRHSIGVMLIASYLYLKIHENNKKNNENSIPIRNELEFLQLSAFLHDTGHLPFSHLLEEIFQEFGWISSGETKTFNHEQHTKKIVKNIFENNQTFKEKLWKTGYTIDDLLHLINGEFGVGYLDALINSPLDCDKIEYLFSDAVYTGRGNKADLEFFLNGFAEELSFNSNKFLVIEGESTKSFLKLLEMRGQMYEDVYLRSGLRYLEACCKLIIKTFIVYKCAEESLFARVEQNSDSKFHNLSESKIAHIIEWFNTQLDEFEEKMSSEENPMPDTEKICEQYILSQMVDFIKKNTAIADEIKAIIDICHNNIKNTKNKEGVKRLEKENIKTYTFSISEKIFNREKLNNLVKDVYLRFPGILMVDFVQSKAAFSFGGTGIREERIDGTSSSVESILIKDIHPTTQSRKTDYQCLGDAVKEINDKLHFPNFIHINIYRISENPFKYMQAEDFVLNQLRREGIISYEQL